VKKVKKAHSETQLIAHKKGRCYQLLPSLDGGSALSYQLAPEVLHGRH
jgi:hypothetical protein